MRERVLLFVGQAGNPLLPWKKEEKTLFNQRAVGLAQARARGGYLYARLTGFAWG